jgi:hypothetical protein
MNYGIISALYMLIFLSDESKRADIICHDFHVSKLDVRFNPENKHFECTLHLFLDDLENAMNASGYKVHKMETGFESKETQSKIEQYLSQKLKIFVDNKPVPFTYMGKEEAERFDAVFMYLEGAGYKTPKSVTIENHLFHEIFSDQKNIVSFTYDKTLKAFSILDKKNTRKQINL